MEGLSLIVPIHNGEGFIESSLRDYNRFFSKKFKKFQLIVVCNACTDNSLEVCVSLKNEIKSLNILDVPKRGKGNALIVGLRKAKYEYIGFLDSDNPFDLNKIYSMILKLKENDVVIVTKFKKGDLKKQSSLLRRFFSINASFFSYLILRLKFKDTQAGAKFMKKKYWNKIDGKFYCTGFEFDMELLYKLKKVNANIHEFYLLPKSSDFSTVKLRILPGIMFRLLKLRFNDQ